MPPNISRETFNALNQYVSVRLQQGVPLVDADWNEEEEIRQFELRAFLKWFVGDGIPVGNNGFEIIGIDANDDVQISAGNSIIPPDPETDPARLREGLAAGRCLVDGLEALIVQDINFSAQPIEDPDAPSLDPIPEGVEILMYLDVWERDITAEMDANLFIPGVGVESCYRRRREWVVRARAGNTLPSTGDADFLPSHAYLALAQINRPEPTASITPETVTDLRRRGVTVPSALDINQITQDVFGANYSLNQQGQGQLSLPLRDVINAILQDGRPARIGPQVIQTENAPHDFPVSVLLGGTQWLFWGNSSGERLVFQKRLGSVDNEPTVAFTFPGNQQGGMAVVRLSDDLAPPSEEAILLVYSARVSGQWQILGRQRLGNVWQDEIMISSEEFGVQANSYPVAARDGNGNVMVAWGQGSQVFARQFIAGVPQPISTAADGLNVQGLALVSEGTEVLHLYVIEVTEVRTKRWLGNAWEENYQGEPVTTTISNEISLQSLAVERDRFGGTWFVWAALLQPGTFVLRARMVKELTESNIFEWASGIVTAPSIMQGLDGNLHVFYRSGNQLEQIMLIDQV